MNDFADVVDLKINEGSFTVESQVGFTYDVNTKKQWKIDSTNGKNFTLQFDRFDLQSSGGIHCIYKCSCSYDKVKIIVDDDIGDDALYCPSEFQSREILKIIRVPNFKENLLFFFYSLNSSNR